MNSGPGQSVKWVQAAVGAKQDGGIGPNTLSRVEEQDLVRVTDDMCERRLTFLYSLSNWDTFGKGWGRRVDCVRTKAMAMAAGRGSAIVEISPSVDYKTVQKGSKGLWVRKLQEALAIQVDGKFGADTQTALKAWQEKHGLEPDGIAGRTTYRSLGLLE